MNKLPYENIQIGYFLYALGYHVSKNGYHISKFSPNLMQQTPLDKDLGDLLIGSTSKCILIEFKRSIDEVKNEINKKNHIVKCMREKGLEEIKLSAKCHLLAIGDYDDKKLEFLFMPYIMMLISQEFRKYNIFEDIVKGNIGIKKDDFIRYYNHMKTCKPDPSPSGCSNCLLIEITENGSIYSYALNNMKKDASSDYLQEFGVNEK
jgi:hypothetical protein